MRRMPTMTTMTTVAEAHAGPDAVYHGDREEWLIALGRSRDSGLIDLSNWAVAQDRLEGLDDWAIERSGHWAVGWVESLIVLGGSDAHREAIVILDDLEGYPLLDEEHHSGLERDRTAETIQGALRSWDFIDGLDAAHEELMGIALDSGRYGEDYYPEDRDVFFAVVHVMRANNERLQKRNARHEIFKRAQLRLPGW
jgi:hypothetical protein